MAHFIIKFIMFYLLQNTQYNFNDFIAGIILYIIYNIYIKIFYKQTIIEFYNNKIKNS